ALDLFAEQDLLAAGALHPRMIRGRGGGGAGLSRLRAHRRSSAPWILAPRTAAANDAANPSTAPTRSPSVGQSSTTRVSALPTITASAKVATRAACSGVEMPKPTPIGIGVNRFTERTRVSRFSGSADRAPVTPATETK